jgi:hypothetical protein
MAAGQAVREDSETAAVTHEVTFRQGDRVVLYGWREDRTCGVVRPYRISRPLTIGTGDTVPPFWPPEFMVLVCRTASPPKPKRGHIPLEHSR